MCNWQVNHTTMEGEVAERKRPPAALAINSTPILLNVGGVRYETMVGTLRLAGPGSFFAGALAHDRPFTVNAAGEYFIDRDGDMFQYVLSFMRTSTLNKVPDSFTNSQWRELQDEALFYGLDSLMEAIAVAHPEPPKSLPDFQPGTPILQCTRLMCTLMGSPRPQLPTERDVRNFDITLRSSVAVVPSQPPGRLFYCVTYQVPEDFNRELEPPDQDGWTVSSNRNEHIHPINVVHRHLLNRLQSHVTRQEDLAKITPAVLRKFQWRPVGIRSGESVSDALTHLLQLLCNGADVIDSPNDFEYSWAVSPICSPGTPRLWSTLGGPRSATAWPDYLLTCPSIKTMIIIVHLQTSTLLST
eukprot:TRINITY_DN5840_c0_g5_i1.p1 TRINITY_DN5840_c0_g5~~TRINITY_DN5840_c0_g5_i1.p1  ORF type:complete len:357 (-),score=38.40 TRINITY_DN5840_c0_g5_i1:167-1237(-)